jgi:hypothetical protein
MVPALAATIAIWGSSRLRGQGSSAFGAELIRNGREIGF